MKILIIEDDAILADGLIHTLRQSGYEPAAARTAAYAYAVLEMQDFDLVILDLGLPDMDGLTFLQKLRRRKIPVPVLILTAREGVDDKIRGLQAGADDYLTKPFERGNWRHASRL